MIIIVLYLIFYFILDGLVSNYLGFELLNLSYFKTIYIVVALVITYNYFNTPKKYLYIILLTGALFDIVYTNTFMLNIIIFLLIYYILTKLDYLIPNNLLTINLKSLVAIYSYHITTYIILLLTHYNSYTIKILLNILLRSSLMTIIYTTISYLLIKRIYWHYFERKIK